MFDSEEGEEEKKEEVVADQSQMCGEDEQGLQMK